MNTFEMRKLKLFFSLLPALLLPGTASAQAYGTYGGQRQFDGTHRNEVYGNLVYGYNVIIGPFFGEAGSYTYHFTDRWSVSAGQQVQFLKKLYSVDVTGTYRLPLRNGNLYLDGRILGNFYGRWRVNEPMVNLSACWESSYVDLRLGMSYVYYHKDGVKEEYRTYSASSYMEPPPITFGLGVNIRPRSHPWNLGLFFRNYDQFYYETWNINWGVRFHSALPWQGTRLYGEFNIRPAGSMSQLATHYETSLKVGLKYSW